MLSVVPGAKSMIKSRQIKPLVDDSKIVIKKCFRTRKFYISDTSQLFFGIKYNYKTCLKTLVETTYCVYANVLTSGNTF